MPLRFIENNEGSLFRGSAEGWPDFVWHSNGAKWAPYTYGPFPKPMGWGEFISDEDAKARWPEAYAAAVQASE